jgi:hypothetical protein
MVRRYLGIALLGLVLTGAPLATASAQQEDPALVKTVQNMLVQRGYLRAPENDWGRCSQRAAAAFLSDDGWAGPVPGLDRVAEELRKAQPNVRRDGEPVC